jgi:hypothetical protein
MFAKDNAVLRESDRFGSHDLVGYRSFQNAILMNARLMCESILSDDRLVWLDINASDIREELAHPADLSRIDTRKDVQMPLADFYRHDDLLQRSIPGTFANTVDREGRRLDTRFHLPYP